jgi:hypothetical protein
MTNYATSTVAMSIYNWIAVNGRMTRSEDCWGALETGPLPGLEWGLFDVAIDELEQRGLITGNGRDGYDITDSQRKILIARDRSDFGYDEETGEVTGGWNDWVPFDRTLGACVLREARP